MIFLGLVGHSLPVYAADERYGEEEDGECDQYLERASLAWDIISAAEAKIPKFSLAVDQLVNDTHAFQSLVTQLKKDLDVTSGRGFSFFDFEQYFAPEIAEELSQAFGLVYEITDHGSRLNVRLVDPTTDFPPYTMIRGDVLVAEPFRRLADWLTAAETLAVAPQEHIVRESWQIRFGAGHTKPGWHPDNLYSTMILNMDGDKDNGTLVSVESRSYDDALTGGIQAKQGQLLTMSSQDREAKLGIQPTWHSAPAFPTNKRVVFLVWYLEKWFPKKK
jgi:hypothetical protein